MPTSIERKEARREQLRQQVRIEILQACAQLIAQKGVVNLSMDEVASLSGLSKGSLYNYFSNRDELIWVVVDTYRQHFLEQADPILNDISRPFPERFSQLVDLTLLSLESEAGLVGVLDYFEEQISKARYAESPMLTYVKQFHASFAPFFAEGIANASVKGKDPMELSVTFVTMAYHLFEYGRLGFLQGGREQHRAGLLSLFLL
jgi:AcrR family transcriptional regulator